MKAKVEKARVIKTKRRRKEKKKRKETRREEKREIREKEKKIKKGKTIDMKKVVEEWETWNDDEEAARSEEEANKLVSEQFHKWIKMFEKKSSERMLTRKVWDYAIDLKERFILREEKVYLLSREEREEVKEFFKSR